MKNRCKLQTYFLILLSVFLFTSTYAQKVKKSKVRLKAEYVKVMGEESYLSIKATSKIKKQNVVVSNIDIFLNNETDDDTNKLGKITTNEKGEAKFVIKNLQDLQSDSTKTFNLKLLFKGNKEFRKAKKSVSFKDADIIAKLVTKDSINYISATLIDKGSDNPIAEESLTVGVQRLFKSLPIGEEFNYTDDNGSIVVPIESGIPGVDGILKIEVILEESDDFGTVKAIVNAPIGKLIVDESTFDERTMWSPRNKTPIFLLIFPNLLIFGIWGLIIYLIANLIKIKKS